MDSLGLIIGIVVTLVTVAGSVYVWITVWGPMMKNARATMLSAQGMMQAQTAAANLRVTGMPAQARILVVRATGTLINFNPQCQVDMDVYPQHAPPYRVSVLDVIHQIAVPRVQPGLVVPVKIDRGNPMNVVLDM
jgi:hypothetical protein